MRCRLQGAERLTIWTKPGRSYVVQQQGAAESVTGQKRETKEGRDKRGDKRGDKKDKGDGPLCLVTLGDVIHFGRQW